TGRHPLLHAVIARVIAPDRSDAFPIHRNRYRYWSGDLICRLHDRELRGEFRILGVLDAKTHFGMEEGPPMWFANGANVADQVVIGGRIVHSHKRTQPARITSELQRLLRRHSKRRRLASAGNRKQRDTSCYNPG